MIFLILFIIGYFGFVLQVALATPAGLFGAHLLPMIMVLVYAAIFTHPANAWALALVFGLITDAFNGTRLGVSSACMMATVGLVMTQSLGRLRNTPMLQLVVGVAAVTFFLVLSYGAFCLERQRFLLGPSLLWSFAATSLLNGALCILFFAVIHPLLTMLGHQPPRDLKYHV